MNGCLLDTLVVLRMLYLPGKLTVRARGLIEDGSQSLFYSAVNLWEIGIKMSVGGYKDLRLPADWQVQIPTALSANDVDALEILPDDCKRAQELPFHHKDPFDRMLLAQALGRGLDVVSSDEAFDAYGVRRIW